MAIYKYYKLFMRICKFFVREMKCSFDEWNVHKYCSLWKVPMFCIDTVRTCFNRSMRPSIARHLSHFVNDTFVGAEN